MNDIEIAAHAAYRVGLIDAMLHEDVVKELQPAGIIVRAFRSERIYRLQQLKEAGVNREKMDEFRGDFVEGRTKP